MYSVSIKLVILPNNLTCTYIQKLKLKFDQKNLGSSNSKNHIIAQIPIKFWFHRLEIEKLWRILDPRIRFCFVNISKFKLNLKVRISERNDKMRQITKSEAFLVGLKSIFCSKIQLSSFNTYQRLYVYPALEEDGEQERESMWVYPIMKPTTLGALSDWVLR